MTSAGYEPVRNPQDEHDEWSLLVPGVIRYGPYDDRDSAETTAVAITVPGVIQRRTVTVTRSEWVDA